MARNARKNKSPLLAVDIGNTAIKAGLVRGLEVLASASVPSGKGMAWREELAELLKKWAGRHHILDGVICSVVPSKIGPVRALARRAGVMQVKVAGQDLPVPMKNRYKFPGRVGADRLVGTFAAAELFGAPVIVVDLGTAITFDVVSPAGEYLGGMIVPGIRLSAETLFRATALLPLARIRRPGALIGRDTESSILSGLFYGYGEMIRGLVRLLIREVPGKPRVVMTGGLTGLMKDYAAPVIDYVEEDLVFKGLALLSETGRGNNGRG